jgi:hypothetical protein
MLKKVGERTLTANAEVVNMKNRMKVSAIAAIVIVSLAVFFQFQGNVNALGPIESKGVWHKLTFVANLSGRTWTSRVSNVTYTIDTRAQGQAIFQFNDDKTEIKFMLIVANIENVTMAHIHIDDGAAVGPIVVWLYPREPPLKLIPGRFNGVLAMGTITSSNLVGPLAGMTLNDLLAKMQAGLAYVVVHTSQHPPGEIRGFIH